MRFSIIIPVYNAEKYLAECLDSVLEQTYTDYEVICINDGSTDNSIEILQNYSQKSNRICVINNSKNMGPSCRNKGLKFAKGDYVLFVDSDDFLCKETLQICKEKLDEEDIDILEFGCKAISERECLEDSLVNEDIRITEVTFPITGMQWLLKRHTEKNYIAIACAKVFSRKFLVENDITFYEGILHEDELFLINCLVKAKKMIAIVDYLYIYRRRDGSVTTQKNKIRNLDSLVVVLNEALVLWKNLEREDEVCIVNNYKKTLIKRIKYLMALYPEHRKMTLGRKEDQDLFDQIYMMEDVLVRKKEKFTEKELSSIKKNKNILVYGAGIVAMEVLRLLEENDVPIKGVVVTHKEINASSLLGYKVDQIDEWVVEKENVMVVVAVAKGKQQEIVENLQGLQFKKILCIER